MKIPKNVAIYNYLDGIYKRIIPTKIACRLGLFYSIFRTIKIATQAVYSSYWFWVSLLIYGIK